MKIEYCPENDPSPWCVVVADTVKFYYAALEQAKAKYGSVEFQRFEEELCRLKRIEGG